MIHNILKGENMIDGFSVLLPTYNMLPYLQLCLESLHKHSKLDNQICILVDGSTDGTIEWLLENGYEFQQRSHRGAFSGWNECAKKAEKDYFFIAEDDFFFCPSWDLRLAEWLEELSSEYIIGANIIEPIHASYIYYDCGSTPEDFDEQKLLEFVKAQGEHSLKAQVFSLFPVSKDDWLAVGGYDEIYDPVAMGTRDLQMKLHKLKSRKWVIANDVMIYHFKPQGPGRVMPYKADQSRAEVNVKYFERKWGLSVEESERYLKG